VNELPAAPEEPAADLLELEGIADEFCAALAEAARTGSLPPLPAEFAQRVSPDRQIALLKLLCVVESERRPRLPGYELVQVIADRNMAVVYEGTDTATGRRVAVKVLRGAERDRAPLQEEFWRTDGEVLADLSHPNIVPVLRVGTHEGYTFLVMPFVEGGDLHHRIADFTLSGELLLCEQQRRVELIEQVARAADHVHRHGVIHRDLKPSNILIGAHNCALVCDFGLAKLLRDRAQLTLTGQLIGTLRYMAPEQARGLRVLTTAVDIWAIGAVLYELMTGHAPFCHDERSDHELSDHELLRRKTEPGATPPAPSELDPSGAVDADLEWICMRCLEPDPARRFESARELADALHRFRTGQRVRPHRSLSRRVREFASELVPDVRRPPAQADYIRRWRWALRTEAGTALIAHGAVLALALSGAAASWVWAAFVLGDTCCAWCAWYAFMSRNRLKPMERAVMQMWTGADLTAVLLFALTVPLTRPPDPAALATFYTGYLLIRGLVLFIEGRACWGRMYWVSGAFYLMAVAIQFAPVYAPALYAGLYSSWFVWLSFCKWEPTAPDSESSPPSVRSS
jgi:serine/threonine-protein kinase